MNDLLLVAEIETKKNDINELLEEACNRNLYIEGCLSVLPLHPDKAPSVKLVIKSIYSRNNMMEHETSH